MSVIWHNPTNQTIGIDVSDHVIRAVVVRHRKRKHTLKRFAEVQLETGWIQNGIIRNVPAIQETLKKSILRSISPASGAAVVGLPEAHGFIKAVAAPADGLEAEMERHLPFPYDEVETDFIDYGPGPDAGTRIFGFAAIKKDVARSYWDLLSSLGLHIRALEVESQAIARAYRHTNPDNQITIVGDIGRNHTTFLVIQNGHIDFTHTSQMISGKLLTGAIQKQTGWTYEQAEQQKVTAPDDPNVKAISDRFGTVLANELQRVVDFHSEHQPTRLGAEYVIYLTGGGSQIPNLRQYMEEKIRYPIQPAVFPDSITVPKKMLPFQHSYSTAIGLGIREYLPL